jgi:hypothetical protein
MRTHENGRNQLRSAANNQITQHKEKQPQAGMALRVTERPQR